MKDKISIIIPVYNAEEFLKRCLDSVLDQTFRNIEVVLINDGSTDSSASICDDYASNDIRIKVFHQNNNGCAHARNTGLRNITGNFVGFVDADDWIEKEMYETLLNGLKQTKSQISVCAATNGSLHKIPMVKNWKRLNKEELLTNYLENGFYIWRNLYSRECLKRIRFQEGVHITSDIIFGIDVIETVDRVAYIDLPLYNYFLDNSTSITRNKYDERKFINFDVNIYLHEKVSAIFENNIKIKHEVRKRVLGNILYHFYKTYQCSIDSDLKKTFRLKLKKHLRENYDFSKDKDITLFLIKHLPLSLIDPFFYFLSQIKKVKHAISQN